jgi:sortase A
MGTRLLTVLSTAFLGSGVVLLLFYGISLTGASRAHQQGLEAFRSAKETQRLAAAADPTIVTDVVVGVDAAAHRPVLDAALDAPDKSLWSEKRISDYEKYSRAAPPDELPEGIMRIPSVDLELPIFTGTHEANLTRGAGTIEGTAPLGTPGNTGIAAHRDGYFRSLKDVSVGDSIVVETLSGTNNYRIDELLIVQPEDVHVLDPTENSTLTLVTCYPFYYVGSAPQRFIVRASKL